MTTISRSSGDTNLPMTPSSEGNSLRVFTWVVQALLALLFLFAGVMKFVTPMDEMTKSFPLSPTFLHFIGVCEVLGACGLILPGALQVRRALTPLAAAGLTVIMVGAVVLTAQLDPKMVAMPVVTGLFTAFVAWRRWSWVSG